MYIPAWLILSGIFAFFFFIISLFASLRGISLIQYWSVPVAAVLPWLAVFIMVFVWTTIKGSNSESQAMAMSGMFPMLGGMAVWIIASIISFFLSPDYALNSRILWSLIISGIPALILGGFLVYAFLQK